jgi:putative ABC transport system permease protein
MNWVAWKMLNGDTVKYLATVFGVAFGVLLIAQQCSIFVGIIGRTANPIADVREPDIWVMDPYLQNSDEIKPLTDGDIYRIRGLTGVDWAVRMYKGLARAKVESGMFRQVILLGIDDHTLIGAPDRIIMGDLADLRQPDAVMVDAAGYNALWPGEPFKLGRELEMNDRRAKIVGICNTSAPFQTFPVMFARYSQAIGFTPKERNQLSFIVASPEPGYTSQEVCNIIKKETEFEALTYRQFFWLNIGYYLEHTGIPVNFGITIALGFIVGTAIAGQTFYLFTLENLKQFGALKAMGVTNMRLLGMVLLQAMIVGVIGYSLGMGLTAVFFEVSTKMLPDLRGLHLLWEIAAGTAVVVVFIIIFASVLSVQKVLRLEPAVVFR